MVVIWSVITDQFFRSVIWSVIWLFLVVLGKRTRESQVESVNSYTTRSRRQGPMTILGSSRGTSTEQRERLECSHCHKYHSGTCKLITRDCFHCGNMDHLIVNCS